MSASGGGVACAACRTLALIWILPLYWFVVLPRARRELRHWDARARTIEDPSLRRLALEKLRRDRSVVEGAAAFAVLARPRHGHHVVRACVAFEVMYEFVDIVGEQPVEDPLAHNRNLHRALVAAVRPDAPCHDPFAHAPSGADGGYVEALILACRSALARLPGHRAILPALQRLAATAAEVQSLNHASRHSGRPELALWASSHAVQDATWWELAAAASSPLGIYALFAAASDRQTGRHAVAAIENAYFPWIGALVWLMESLVDVGEDAQSGNPCYVAQYASWDLAAARLAELATRASQATRALPRAPAHAVLLAAAVSLYLSSPQARSEELRVVSRAVAQALGGPAHLLIAMLRLRLAIANRRELGTTRERRRLTGPSQRDDRCRLRDRTHVDDAVADRHRAVRA